MNIARRLLCRLFAIEIRDQGGAFLTERTSTTSVPQAEPDPPLA